VKSYRPRFSGPRSGAVAAAGVSDRVAHRASLDAQGVLYLAVHIWPPYAALWDAAASWRRGARGCGRAVRLGVV